MPASRLKPLALPATLAACVLLASCGGSSPTSVSNAAAKEQAKEHSVETKFQEFARCLREHGINAEAITHPGGGHGLKIEVGPGGEGAMQAAEKVCARYKPKEGPKGTEPPQVRAEHEEQTRRFAKCMREHGIPVEAAPNGGIFIKANPGSGISPESPTFKAAQRACRKLLPGGGPPE